MLDLVRNLAYVGTVLIGRYQGSRQRLAKFILDIVLLFQFRTDLTLGVAKLIAPGVPSIMTAE